MEVFLNETYISNVHHLVVVECDDGMVSYNPPKNQIAAVTQTGEILTRRSHTIATRRSHLHVETACQ